MTKFDHMERLIELVRENPVLYDQSSHRYKDSTMTNNTWQKISDTFASEGITVGGK